MEEINERICYCSDCGNDSESSIASEDRSTFDVYESSDDEIFNINEYSDDGGCEFCECNVDKGCIYCSLKYVIEMRILNARPKYIGPECNCGYYDSCDECRCDDNSSLPSEDVWIPPVTWIPPEDEKKDWEEWLWYNGKYEYIEDEPEKIPYD